MKIKLIPKTAKGKHILKRHATDIWDVREERPRVEFAKGTHLLINPENDNSNYNSRWIALDDDKDFDWEEVK